MTDSQTIAHEFLKIPPDLLFKCVEHCVAFLKNRTTRTKEVNPERPLAYWVPLVEEYCGEKLNDPACILVAARRLGIDYDEQGCLAAGLRRSPRLSGDLVAGGWPLSKPPKKEFPWALANVPPADIEFVALRDGAGYVETLFVKPGEAVLSSLKERFTSRERAKNQTLGIGTDGLCWSGSRWHTIEESWRNPARIWKGRGRELPQHLDSKFPVVRAALDCVRENDWFFCTDWR